MPPELVTNPNQSTTSSENNSTTQQENPPAIDSSLVTNNETPIVQQPSTDVAALWQAVAQDNARRAQEAERRIQELESRINAPPPPAPIPVEQQREQYFTDPVGTMRAVLQQDLQQIIAPVNQQIGAFTRQNEIARLKGLMKNHPQYKYLNIPQFESWFDQQLNSIQTINDSTLTALYSSIVGFIAMNQPDILTQMNAAFQPQNNTPVVQQQPQNTTQQQPPRSQLAGNNPNVITPPHLRPQNSNPPAAPQTAQREYTENEKRLMRERGMTPAQYDALMNADSLVTNWRTLLKPEGK